MYTYHVRYIIIFFPSVLFQPVCHCCSLAFFTFFKHFPLNAFIIQWAVDKVKFPYISALRRY